MSLFKSKEEKAREIERARAREREKIEAERKAEKERKDHLEKSKSYVLTISASDYVSSKDKDLSNYNFKSIFTEETWKESALMAITREGTAIGAEIIVAVRPSHNTGYHESRLFLIGTALIPKD